MVSDKRRNEIVENLIEGQHRQIISLGAGYDTFYFNQKAAKKANFENVKYVEMDLPGVIKRKVKRFVKIIEAN